MRSRSLVVTLLVAAALTGCLAGSGPEDAPGASQEDPVGELNETVLKGGRATVSVDAGDRATLRISTEGWSDQQWALAVIADRSPNATRYVGIASDHPA